MVHAGRAGSITLVTDGLGSAVAQNRYGIFGQVATTNANSGDPLQFLGGMSDPSTGLHFLGSHCWALMRGLSIPGWEPAEARKGETW